MIWDRPSCDTPKDLAIWWFFFIKDSISCILTKYGVRVQ